jgi:hypothetical protein
MSKAESVPNPPFTTATAAEQVQDKNADISTMFAAELAELALVPDSANSGDFSWALADIESPLLQADVNLELQAGCAPSADADRMIVELPSTETIAETSNGLADASKTGEATEEEDEDEEDIDIDADGLRSIESCLTFIFIAQEGDPSKRLCQLCRLVAHFSGTFGAHL